MGNLRYSAEKGRTCFYLIPRGSNLSHCGISLHINSCRREPEERLSTIFSCFNSDASRSSVACAVHPFILYRTSVSNLRFPSLMEITLTTSDVLRMCAGAGIQA